MENQEQTNTTTQSASTQPMIRRNDVGGWSWGAFVLDPFFIIAIKKYSLLWMYLLYLVPLVNFFAMIGIKIFLGIKGHQLVAESTVFKNEDEQNGFVRAIDHAGFIVFIVGLVGIVVMFLFFGVILASLFSAFGGGMGGRPY